ncbi:MAG: serpin family protein [Oscillospiraceae bacterium]|nr:serpin family protein [Oscillospiraceae bacterium]
MKRILAVIVCLILCTAALCGCARPAQEPSADEPGLKPDTDYNGVTSLVDNAGAQTPPDLKECTDFAAAQQFGLKLFSETLQMGNENPVISPASAYLCLAMVMNGAGSETLAEFEEVMGGDLETVNSLAYTLSNKVTDIDGNTILEIANSLWADDKRVYVEEDFLKRVSDYYDGEIYSADMDSKEALDAINSWVNEKTNGLIPTLHEDTYPDDTKIVLLNTIYLKAKWQKLFEGYSTRDKIFTKADDKELTVPFMQMYFETQQYINTDGAEGVVLPYDDNQTVFFALRPTDGSTARDFAKSMDSESLDTYLTSAEEKTVNLSMPKFNLAYELYLTDALTAMGLESAFDTGADLSAMGRGIENPLQLSHVFQKVKIEVNEEGTEAAAVTEAVAADGATAVMEDPAELHLDSPFVYGVMDTETGVPLFIGLLEDPSAE